jgi:hypothetical protein
MTLAVVLKKAFGVFLEKIHYHLVEMMNRNQRGASLQEAPPLHLPVMFVGDDGEWPCCFCFEFFTIFCCMAVICSRL